MTEQKRDEIKMEKTERHFDDERCPKCDSPNISYSSIFGLKCQDCGYESKHPLID